MNYGRRTCYITEFFGKGNYVFGGILTVLVVFLNLVQLVWGQTRNVEVRYTIVAKVQTLRLRLRLLSGGDGLVGILVAEQKGGLALTYPF